MIVLKIDSWMRERLEVASREMPCARFGAIPIQGVLKAHQCESWKQEREGIFLKKLVPASSTRCPC
jgi:hypothetical protein